MFNPLLPDLSELKTTELENKISELSKKYWIAARSGNGALCEQILVVLESYKYELQSKNLAANKIPTKSGETGLDDLINIS
jgi:hypothetical protein